VDSAPLLVRLHRAKATTDSDFLRLYFFILPPISHVVHGHAHIAPTLRGQRFLNDLLQLFLP